MRAQSPLPVAGSGTIFFTEGGSETEIMYRHGFELPEFALFPLLDIPSAVTAMRDMFRDAHVIRQHGFINETRFETFGQVSMGLAPELGFVAL